jgi:hypothetical protein
MADEDPIHRLYALPPGEFVAARDALAKELRSGGDREGAAAVKKLGRPTRAAAAVNRLTREHPAEIRALVDAGAALAGAQEQLLDGADAGVLRGAAEAARHLVDALAEEADEDVRDKVRATLHAATVDDDVREEVASGRLVKERSASGFGGLEALIAAGVEGRPAAGNGKGKTKAKAKGAKAKGRARAGAAAEDGAAAPATTKAPPKPKGPDPREVRRRRDALRRAKEGEAKAETALAGAQRSLAQVEATIAARRKDLEAAEAALAEARDRRERAERVADEL